ncbi:MAG TPA: undecaprenyl-diphosphate phosphatase [Gaiellaceae bacterium]|jgi:undecaprenyl-diphosphatase|nr:undecaprenyl-diphosphate phosphatase [Gaiellaceae bacterium]
MRRAGILVVAGGALAVAALLAIAGVGEVPGALTNWQAFVLGVVQGATELLPISSSGHLILVPWLFEWEYLETHEEFNQTFDVALHVGTLVAVVAYFWNDVTRLIAAWLASVRRRSITSPDERIAWFVAIATVPAAAIGALGENLIADNLGEPWQIAIFLAVFGVLLWIADKTPATKQMSDLGPGTALAVGFAQSLALMPGVSRSGITITMARFLGLDRDSAARFSFLLLIPIVFGASLWKGVTDVLLGDLPPGWEGPFVVGMIAAAGSGLLAIWGLLGYVRRHDYTIFVVYRLIAAAVIVLLIVTNVRAATF